MGSGMKVNDRLLSCNYLLRKYIINSYSHAPDTGFAASFAGFQCYYIFVIHLQLICCALHLTRS